MPTTPGPVRTRRSPTPFRTAVPYVAGPPALPKLPDNHSARQLHPHPPAGQLHSEGQRVQLQGLWGRSCKRKTLLAVSAFQFPSHPYLNVVVPGAWVWWEECVVGDGFWEQSAAGQRSYRGPPKCGHVSADTRDAAGCVWWPCWLCLCTGEADFSHFPFNVVMHVLFISGSILFKTSNFIVVSHPVMSPYIRSRRRVFSILLQWLFLGKICWICLRSIYLLIHILSRAWSMMTWSCKHNKQACLRNGYILLFSSDVLHRCFYYFVIKAFPDVHK